MDKTKISSILYKNILTSKFAGFLKMLILTDYFLFLNITLSYKNSHQLGQNQPTDMLVHSIESKCQGDEIEYAFGDSEHSKGPPNKKKPDNDPQHEDSQVC